MLRQKAYFCTKSKDFFTRCGETDPEKFIPGRYSTCKECKKMYDRSAYKVKKMLENETRDPDLYPIEFTINLNLTN
jgi:hypothetical protein